MRLANLTAIFLVGCLNTAISAEFVDDPDRDLEIRGEIVVGDADLFAEIVRRRFPAGSQYDWVFLNSTGGDLYEAIEIGRIIRSTGLSVSIQPNAHCYSSCTLLLAAGTGRAVFGSVAVHRPYLAAADAETDFQEVYEKMDSSLRSFLEEMRVPLSLADLIMSIPPEKPRALSPNEISLYFPTEDPVADEIETTRDAKKRGITNGELRRRQALAEIECSFAAQALEAAKQANDKDRRFSEGIRLITCRNAVSWSLTFEEYVERMVLASETCQATNNEECRLSILRE